MANTLFAWDQNQGPVVQSIVSLTSSLRGQLIKCFSVLRLYNQTHWNFLLKKWEKLFQLQKLLTFFQQKYWHIWEIIFWKFNETLTKDVVCSEQPGPACLNCINPNKGPCSNKRSLHLFREYCFVSLADIAFWHISTLKGNNLLLFIIGIWK